MRLATLVLAIAGCGPKHSTGLSPFEEDDPRAGGAPVVAQRSELRGSASGPVGWDARPEAPAGKGERGGTIDRSALLRVLDAGPGAFLRQLEVSATMDGDRFVGWQLVQILDDGVALERLDLAAGDVLVAVNGAPIARPDHLMRVWNGLRTADKLVCDVLRGDNRFQLSFTIAPPIGRVPPDMATPAQPPAAIQPPPATTPPPSTTPPGKPKK